MCWGTSPPGPTTYSLKERKMPPSERSASFESPEDLHQFLLARRSKGSLSAHMSEEIAQKLAGLRLRWPDHTSWLGDVALLPPRTAALVLARAWPDLDLPARREVVAFVRKDLRHGVPTTALWLCAAAPDVTGAQEALMAAVAAVDRPTVSREFARAAGEALIGSEWPGPFHRLVQAAEGKPQTALLGMARVLLERSGDLPVTVRAGHLADQAAVWLRSDSREAAIHLKQVAGQLADASPASLAAFHEFLAGVGVAEAWQSAQTRLGLAADLTAAPAAVSEEGPSPAAAPVPAPGLATAESEAVSALRAAADRVADLLRAATLEGIRSRAEVAHLQADLASRDEALRRSEAAGGAMEARAAEAAQQLAALQCRIGDLQAELAQLHDIGERRYRAGQQAVAARVSQDIRLRVATLRQFWGARQLSEGEQHVRALVEDLLEALARNGVSLE